MADSGQRGADCWRKLNEERARPQSRGDCLGSSRRPSAMEAAPAAGAVPGRRRLRGGTFGARAGWHRSEGRTPSFGCGRARARELAPSNERPRWRSAQ
jgi:hypothetical protein